MGRAVALTTAACLITALPAAAQSAEPTTTEPTSSQPTSTSTGEPTSTSEPTGTSTSEPTSSSAPTSTSTGEPTTSEPTSSQPTSEPTSTSEPAPEPGEGAITERYEGLPEDIRGQIGEPTAEEVVVSDSLRYRDYDNARFYWTPEHGVKIVFGGILGKFLAMGAHEEVGVPTSDERPTEDGVARYSTFVDRESGTETAIYWTPDTGAHEIRGPILQHWRELGAGPVLGYPSTDSNATPDGFGVYNHFASYNGADSSIYWTRPHGAHAVEGGIRATWAASGWEQGPLGYPVTDKLVTDDGAGRYNEFSRSEGAVVVWSPETGAHAVHGEIGKRYAQLGGPNGFLGLPTTDPTSTPDGRGRYNHFTGTGGASIYWTSSTGAHEVYGGIRDHWSAMGWERSYLGYPTSGEYAIEVGRRSDFQGGTITYDREAGTVTDQPY